MREQLGIRYYGVLWAYTTLHLPSKQNDKSLKGIEQRRKKDMPYGLVRSFWLLCWGYAIMKERTGKKQQELGDLCNEKVRDWELDGNSGGGMTW